jgi:hypothetical protein
MIQGHSNVPLLPEKKKKTVGLKKYVNFLLQVVMQSWCDIFVDNF